MKKIKSEAVKKLKILLIAVLVICLGASGLLNIYLYRTNKRVKNSVVYSLSDDYLLNQIIITKNTKENEKKLSEFKYAADDKDGNLNYAANGGFSFSDAEIIKKVQKINQLPDYPNGCEAASATMLLNYFGVKITLKEFIEEYLPTKDIYQENGSRFGPDPSVYYAGNQASKEHGWGCYEPVIENTVNRILYDKNIQNLCVENLNQKPISELLYYYPVVIWVINDYSEADGFSQWYSYDKKKTYTYSNKTHAVLLTGQDKDFYYIADPLKSEEITKVEKSKLEKSYDSMGRQAVTICNINNAVYINSN